MAAQRFPMLRAPIHGVVDLHVFEELPSFTFGEHRHGQPSCAFGSFDAHAIALAVRGEL